MEKKRENNTHFLYLDDYELAIAQDTGAGQGDIIVDLQMDNEAARRAKMEEAEQKRAQNALPVWHQRSTISDTILVGTGDRPVDQDDQEDDDAFEDIGQGGMDADTEDCKTLGNHLAFKSGKKANISL